MLLPQDRTEGGGGVVPPPPPPLQAILLLGDNEKEDAQVLLPFTSSWYAADQGANVALSAIAVILILES